MAFPNRREFLLKTSALAAASFAPSMLLAQNSSSEIEAHSEPKIPTPDTTLKFNPDGTQRPFAGNTVICHLPVQCAMRDEMIELHDAFAQASYRHKLGLTSTDSYHMTIFPGANDQNRTAYGWPSYVPANAPIEVCSSMVGERIAKTRFSCQLPLRMRVDQAHTINFTTACSLRMIAADADEEIKLRSLRDQLASAFGFRGKDHTTYQFHITMSYQMSPFTPQEQSAYRQLLKTHIERIVDAEPILELGIPEYCTFPDMFRFEPQRLLVCG